MVRAMCCPDRTMLLFLWSEAVPWNRTVPWRYPPCQRWGGGQGRGVSGDKDFNVINAIKTRNVFVCALTVTEDAWLFLDGSRPKRDSLVFINENSVRSGISNRGDIGGNRVSVSGLLQSGRQCCYHCLQP